jgi:hypothetical protein
MKDISLILTAGAALAASAYFMGSTHTRSNMHEPTGRLQPHDMSKHLQLPASGRVPANKVADVVKQGQTRLPTWSHKVKQSQTWSNEVKPA